MPTATEAGPGSLSMPGYDALPMGVLVHIAEHLGPCAAMRAACRTWRDAHDATCEALCLRAAPRLAPEVNLNIMYDVTELKCEQLLGHVRRMVVRMTRLRSLVSSDNYQPLSIGPLVDSLKGLTGLQHLRLWAQDDMHALSQLTGLTHLSLSSSGVLDPEQPTSSWLSTLTGLRDLEIHGWSGDWQDASSGITALTGLTRLDLNDHTVAEEIEDLSMLSRLKVLCVPQADLPCLPPSLERLHTSDQDLEKLEGLQLCSLSLFEGQITAEGLPEAALQHLTELEAAEVSVEILAAMTKLQSLTLTEEMPLEGLSSLTLLTSLSKLHLQGVEGHESSRQLSMLTALTQLQQLHLVISDGPIEHSCSMAWVSALTRLTSLTISHRFAITEIVGPESFTALTGLRQLAITNNCFFSEGSTLSTSLQPWAQLMPGLTSLHLCRRQISLCDISDLAAATQLQELLGLPCSSISNLAPLSALPHLQTLQLEGAVWGEEFAASLSVLSQLTRLALHGTVPPTQETSCSQQHQGHRTESSPSITSRSLSVTGISYEMSLSPLSGLSSLVHLHFELDSSHNSRVVDDLSVVLSALTRLTELFVSRAWDSGVRTYANREAVLKALPRLPIPITIGQSGM